MKKIIIFIILISFSFLAKAEYRAYQYIVKTKDSYAAATNAQAQYIISTLNPSMFISYHGGSYISADLLRTWICPGYTGKGKDICQHPYDKGKATP